MSAEILNFANFKARQAFSSRLAIVLLDTLQTTVTKMVGYDFETQVVDAFDISRSVIKMLALKNVNNLPEFEATYGDIAVVTGRSEATIKRKLASLRWLSTETRLSLLIYKRGGKEAGRTIHSPNKWNNETPVEAMMDGLAKRLNLWIYENIKDLSGLPKAYATESQSVIYEEIDRQALTFDASDKGYLRGKRTGNSIQENNMNKKMERHADRAMKAIVSEATTEGKQIASKAYLQSQQNAIERLVITETVDAEDFRPFSAKIAEIQSRLDRKASGLKLVNGSKSSG